MKRSRSPRASTRRQPRTPTACRTIRRRAAAPDHAQPRVGRGRSRRAIVAGAVGRMVVDDDDLERGYVVESTERTHRSMLRGSLRAGMTTETSGASAPTSAVYVVERSRVARPDAAPPIGGSTIHGSDHRTGATADISRARRMARGGRRLLCAARDDRRRGELAGDVRRRAEHVRNGVDAEQNADALDRQPDARQHRHHRDDRAAGNSRNAEARDHRREHDRHELRGADRNAVEPRDEHRARREPERRADAKHRRRERQKETADLFRAAGGASAPSISAGSAASDERDEIATACAGARGAREIAQRDAAEPRAPPDTSTNSANTATASDTSTTYAASAPTAESPAARRAAARARTRRSARRRAAIARRRASTRSGRGRSRPRGRASSARGRRSASPSMSANTISGSIAPSAAARTGSTARARRATAPGVCIAAALDRTSPAPGALARSVATAAGSMLTADSTGGATSAPTVPDSDEQNDEYRDPASADARDGRPAADGRDADDQRSTRRAE